MRLRVPDYYKDFHCIADQCTDSCCIGWEIDIDEETLDYYKSVEGPFGDRLREHIREGRETSFVLQKGRCPFLNQQNLCDICTELGETSLCEICTEYPRFTMEFGNVREKCLGISCEEAARLIFESEKKLSIVESVLSEDYEEEEPMDRSITKARDHVLTMLQNREYPIEMRLYEVLRFAEEVQKDMNVTKLLHIESIIKEFSDQALSIKMEEQQRRSSKRKGQAYFLERMEVFERLEVLEKRWHSYVKDLHEVLGGCSDEEYEAYLKEYKAYLSKREYELEHLLCYFVFRYGMKAVYDGSFLNKIKFATASFLMIRDMDVVRFIKNGYVFSKEDRIDVAKIYSKQVEHSEDNLEELEDAFTFDTIFSTETMLRQI